MKHIILAIALLTSLLSCEGKTLQDSENTSAASHHEVISVKLKDPGKDEEAFRQTLAKLKMLLKSKKIDAAATALNFPFFTARTNEGSGLPIDPIASKDYPIYKNDVFNADVVRLFPACTEDQLSEIDLNTDDPYYLSLAKLTDRGSHLYEVYFQYPEKGTNAESFFGFVFGRVQGKYKAIGMYGKWPVK